MTIHVPVLPSEVLELLAPPVGGVVVDGTLGGGGHTRLLANRVGPNGQVIAIDRDPNAITAAESALQGMPVVIAHASYADVPEVLAEVGISAVDGILLDLGYSSDQIEDNERGFSFHSNGPLDLRFDAGDNEPAWRLLERLSEKHLANLLYEYGEERLSRRIARKIVARRREAPIRTARELAEIVERAVPRNYEQRIHPATRTFQALRIAVNDELGVLDTALRRLPDCLREQGRLAVISFHSLEDRRVKSTFRQDDRLRALTSKPITPSEEEQQENPRSRSAKLRVAERTSVEHASS